jgi:hypothetical protein
MLIEEGVECIPVVEDLMVAIVQNGSPPLVNAVSLR